MKYILILILINLFFTSSIYVLYLKKCNDNSNYIIDFLRYQYDIKHYPIYCNNKFEYNNIKYMSYNLNHDFNNCNHLNKKNTIKDNILYWKYIYNMYGSCSNFENYEYFNKTLQLFYKHNKLINNYNCIHNNYCKIVFNNNFKYIK